MATRTWKAIKLMKCTKLNAPHHQTATTQRPKKLHGHNNLNVFFHK